MKSISVVLGIILALSLFTREFNWKARGLLIAAIMVMIALTIW
jgi:hypothetical protein